MKDVLSIQNIFTKYKNISIALEIGTEQICHFLKCDQFLFYKRDIEKNSSRAFYELLLSNHRQTSSKLVSHNFDKTVYNTGFLPYLNQARSENSDFIIYQRDQNYSAGDALYNLFGASDVVTGVIILITVQNEIWGAFIVNYYNYQIEFNELIQTKALVFSNILKTAIQISDTNDLLSRGISEDHSYKMASLGKLAASIAHEINNPIFVIGGLATKLEQLAQKNKEISSFDVSKFAAIINQNCNKMTEIIENLRLMSRNTKNDRLEVCDVNQLVKGIISLSTEKFKLNKIEIRNELSHNEFLIECRPSHLSQVFTNLFNNSFDSLISKNQDRWVKLTSLVIDGNVIIEFEDSGARPSEEILKNMMNPFFTTKEVGKGSGLGLSISKEIISKYGGEFFVDAACENMKFIIKLPELELDEDPE